MASGASALAARQQRKGRFDGLIVLGGTMGTDLALDVCSALPVGVPKYIVSTVAFSPLITPERLAADIQMILWAGGLYGLNSICKSSLSQAAGAVLGATAGVEAPAWDRPLIGMTSLGKSALKCMVTLKPALEERGFEVAVFHATGMGGRAFKNLAAQGAFAFAPDLCTQELGNHVHGSSISAGADRLTNAGKAGVPQIVAPGCYDLFDIVGYRDLPEKWAGHIFHAHNRLLTSIVLNSDERRALARAHAEQLAKATGKTAFIPPAGLYDPEVLAAFCDEMRSACPSNVAFQETPAHI